MPHDPKFKLTRITRYGVNIGAATPMFDAFMAETFDNDDEMIGFIQRLCGLMLLGKVTEHILPFWFGSGANGKGCLALICQGILGDADAGGYAVSAYWFSDVRAGERAPHRNSADARRTASRVFGADIGPQVR